MATQAPRGRGTIEEVCVVFDPWVSDTAFAVNSRRGVLYRSIRAKTCVHQLSLLNGNLQHIFTFENTSTTPKKLTLPSYGNVFPFPERFQFFDSRNRTFDRNPYLYPYPLHVVLDEEKERLYVSDDGCAAIRCVDLAKAAKGEEVKSTVLVGGRVPLDSKLADWFFAVHDPKFTCTFSEIQFCDKFQFMTLDKVHQKLFVLDTRRVIFVLDLQSGTYVSTSCFPPVPPLLRPLPLSFVPAIVPPADAYECLLRVGVPSSFAILAPPSSLTFLRAHSNAQCTHVPICGWPTHMNVRVERVTAITGEHDRPYSGELEHGAIKDCSFNCLDLLCVDPVSQCLFAFRTVGRSTSHAAISRIYLNQSSERKQVTPIVLSCLCGEVHASASSSTSSSPCSSSSSASASSRLTNASSSHLFTAALSSVSAQSSVAVGRSVLPRDVAELVLSYISDEEVTTIPLYHTNTGAPVRTNDYHNRIFVPRADLVFDRKRYKAYASIWVWEHAIASVDLISGEVHVLAGDQDVRDERGHDLTPSPSLNEPRALALDEHTDELFVFDTMTSTQFSTHPPPSEYTRFDPKATHEHFLVVKRIRLS